MYTLTDSEYVSKRNDDAEKKEKIVGRISDEKLGKLNLIIKTDAQGEPILNKKGDTIPMGLAEFDGPHNVAGYFIEGGKFSKTYHYESYHDRPMAHPETLPKIKLYKSQKLFDRILASLKDTALWPVLTAAANIDEKTVRAEEFESKVNELCADPEYQFAFIITRKKLIENELMPVDDAGHAYDLSTCYIPQNVQLMPLLNGLQLDKPELVHAFRRAYIEKNTAQDVTEEKVRNSLHELRAEQPAVFMGIYNYAVEKGHIPPSPVLTELKLGPQQKAFLEKPAIIDFWAEIALWSEIKQEPISEMRYGTADEQKAYHRLCSLIQNTRMMEWPEEKPSYPKRRKEMFKTIAQKQARTTIENRL